MAAITAPGRTAAQHQSLLHFIGQGGWSDEEVLAKVREMVLPRIERHGPIRAWIIDDTSFPKKGRHSVGVAHQGIALALAASRAPPLHRWQPPADDQGLPGLRFKTEVRLNMLF
jgi:hypothetical protein